MMSRIVEGQKKIDNLTLPQEIKQRKKSGLDVLISLIGKLHAASHSFLFILSLSFWLLNLCCFFTEL